MKTWQWRRGNWILRALALTLGVLVAGCQSPTPKFSSNLDLEPPLATNEKPDSSDLTNRIEMFRLQIGDKVHIELPATRELLHTRITDDGTITLPNVGTVGAAERTVPELYADIVSKDPRFRTCGLAVCGCELNYRITGEVNSPGMMEYLSEMTLVRAVELAGGLTENADRKRIQLIHAGGRKETFNYDKILGGKSPSIRLWDTIIVRRKE